MKSIRLWALCLYVTCACMQVWAQAPAASAAPDSEDCLKQKPALQTLESKLQDGEQTLTLADISHRAMLFIEVCGGGGAGANADTYRSGGGGGSAPINRLLLRCGEHLGAWAGSRNRLLDCRSPVSVKVPGRASSGQSGGAAMLMIFGGDGVPVSMGGEGARPMRAVGDFFLSEGGAGFRNGGQGSSGGNDVRSAVATAGAKSDFFSGGAPGENPSNGGGGGGASGIGDGGNGGALGQPGGDGGLCAGGGGAGQNFRDQRPTGGRGGPGYARIVALDINEVANCGRAALLKNLQFEVSRLVQEELKKAVAPLPAAQAPTTSSH